jgi:hypothetical protein
MRAPWIWIAGLAVALLMPVSARAVSSLDPVPGPAPVSIGMGATVDIDIQLSTTDLVGAFNAEFFESAGLTINGCSNPGGAPGWACSAISGGYQANAADFAAGLPDGLTVVRLNVTGNAMGGELTLGVFPTTNFTDCPGFPCIGGSSASFANQGDVLAVVVPEPATMALVSVGLLGLALSGRRRA